MFLINANKSQPFSVNNWKMAFDKSSQIELIRFSESWKSRFCNASSRYCGLLEEVQREKKTQSKSIGNTRGNELLPARELGSKVGHEHLITNISS